MPEHMTIHVRHSSEGMIVDLDTHGDQLDEDLKLFLTEQVRSLLETTGRINDLRQGEDVIV